MFSVPTNRFVPKHETQNFVKKAEMIDPRSAWCLL